MTDPTPTTTRRNAILGGIAAAGAAWVAPAILTVDAAAAASDNDYTLTVTLDDSNCPETPEWSLTITGPDGYNETRSGTGAFSETFGGLVPGEYTIAWTSTSNGGANSGGETLIVPPSETYPASLCQGG